MGKLYQLRRTSVRACKVSVDRLDHLDQILFEKANADRKRFQSLIKKMC